MRGLGHGGRRQQVDAGIIQALHSKSCQRMYDPRQRWCGTTIQKYQAESTYASSYIYTDVSGNSEGRVRKLDSKGISVTIETHP
jgi:hypothetical protein